MNLSFKIAGKYLVSKKTHNIINLISYISITGIFVGTAALIIILSVFNGFEDLVRSLMNTFNADLVIVPRKGKVFNINSVDRDAIQNINGVLSYTEYIEENALIKYNNEQFIATIKGLSDEYLTDNPVDSAIVAGDFVLKNGSVDFAIIGYLIAYRLGINLNDAYTPMQVYVPRRLANNFSGLDLGNAFNTQTIMPGAVFSIQQDFDSKYILTPLRFTQQLFEYSNDISGIEIRLNKSEESDRIQSEISGIVGDGFVVKNRFQQQETLYRVMESEKWAIFFILTFILIIATFNLVGSVSILILDKRKDMSVLYSMGATHLFIRRIFIKQGFLITVFGVILGLLVGGILCYLQQEYGLIRLSDKENAFIISHYPVKINVLDFVLVPFTVIIIGLVAASIPVLRITPAFLRQKFNDLAKIQ